MHCAGQTGDSWNARSGPGYAELDQARTLHPLTCQDKLRVWYCQALAPIPIDQYTTFKCTIETGAKTL